jgi:hypothetical protein
MAASKMRSNTHILKIDKKVQDGRQPSSLIGYFSVIFERLEPETSNLVRS